MDIFQRAVTLAMETDDAYLNFSLCERRSAAPLAELIELASWARPHVGQAALVRSDCYRYGSRREWRPLDL